MGRTTRKSKQTKRRKRSNFIFSKLIASHDTTKPNIGLYVVLTQSEVNLLYEITGKAITILNKHKINYWATDGTLLGIRRSKGFIPWDDDVDLDIDITDKAKLLSLKDEFKKVNLVIGGVGKRLKIKTPESNKVWIDIFVLTDGKYPQKHFQDINYQPGEIFPLKKGSFGPYKMNIPNKSDKYLDRIFRDWRKIAYIYNHHTKGKKKISFKDYPRLKKPTLPTN